MSGLQSKGLAPEIPDKMNILILGSLPGDKSIADQQYYAHPRNAFWHIMGSLLHFEKSMEYQNRIAEVNAAGIGLWDVIDRAVRSGSLDSAIQTQGLQINELSRLIEARSDLKLIMFNGKKAFQVFQKQVLPVLSQYNLPDFLVLPSTSPANAAMSVSEKTEIWHTALRAGWT